ncbi:unnamed protein product [Symbiodinium natans]|uniref:Uncharacterized protein n=1 Tax=Symbiodinium natans TaxID=878477 RepID=A0A812URL7_9DINO|nr:unnamed protein product [Symbiodinium natans]
MPSMAVPAGSQAQVYPISRHDSRSMWPRPEARSASPCGRAIWMHGMRPVPTPVLTFGTPPRTPRTVLHVAHMGKPDRPAWTRQMWTAPRVCPSAAHVQSLRVLKAPETTGIMRPRRHSAPLQPLQPLQSCVAPVSGSAQLRPGGPVLQESRQHFAPGVSAARQPTPERGALTAMRQDAMTSSQCITKSADSLSSGCFRTSPGACRCVWASPATPVRLMPSVQDGPIVMVSPQTSHRQVRSDLDTTVATATTVTTATSLAPRTLQSDDKPSKTMRSSSCQTSHVDQIRSEMMELLEERERCHQRQLQNLHSFQQERERDHQRQLQQMRKTHEADMRRLEEKLCNLLAERQEIGFFRGVASGSAATPPPAKAASRIGSREEDTDTLLYTEPSLDRTLSPIEADCSQDLAASPLSQASFPSSAILGSESSPMTRSIKMLPPADSQVPPLPGK